MASVVYLGEGPGAPYFRFGENMPGKTLSKSGFVSEEDQTLEVAAGLKILQLEL